MRKTHTGTDIITFWVSNMQMWPSGSSQLTKGVSALHHRLLLIIAKKLPLHRDKLGTYLMKVLSPNSIKSTNVLQQWQPQRQYFHFQYENRRQDSSITEACVLTRTGEQRIKVKVKFYLKGVMGTFI